MIDFDGVEGSMGSRARWGRGLDFDGVEGSISTDNRSRIDFDGVEGSMGSRARWGRGLDFDRESNPPTRAKMHLQGFSRDFWGLLIFKMRHASLRSSSRISKCKNAFLRG